MKRLDDLLLLRDYAAKKLRDVDRSIYKHPDHIRTAFPLVAIQGTPLESLVSSVTYLEDIRGVWGRHEESWWGFRYKLRSARTKWWTRCGDDRYYEYAPDGRDTGTQTISPEAFFNVAGNTMQDLADTNIPDAEKIAFLLWYKVGW